MEVVIVLAEAINWLMVRFFENPTHVSGWIV
jgi:hypothetical protein